MNSKSKSIKYTAFISHTEWFFYYLVTPKNLYFATDPVFVDHNEIPEYHQKIQNSVFFLEIVELRNSKSVPISFQATLELLRLPLLERDHYLSQDDFNKLMLLTITRIVNMLCDTGENSKLGRSIGRILQQLNLRDYGLVTEVRHTATHKTLPSIDVTKAAAKALYEFLIISYWNKQFDACAPFLRDNQDKIHAFVEKMAQEEPHVFKTELAEWSQIEYILNSRKGKNKTKAGDVLVVETEEKGKNRLKRALKIQDQFNKMITFLKKYDLRKSYVENGFEADLSTLTYFLRNTDRILFQKFNFLEYRLKHIIFLKDLCPEFGRIVEGVESKIPSVVKDLSVKSKKKPEGRNLEAVQEEEEALTGKNNKLRILEIEGKLKTEWVPEPIGKNFMSDLQL